MLKYYAVCLSAVLLTGCKLEVNKDSDEHEVSPKSTLVSLPCPNELSDVGATCGALRTAVNRNSSGLEVIDVPYVKLAALKPTSGVPTLFLSGGPGPSPLASLVSLDKSVLNALPLRESSDVYFIDQRGGALTGDDLFCPELVFAPEVGQEFHNIEQVQKAASSCFDRMKKAGVDARDFGTAEFAQDAYELMRLADSKTQFNIVSTSYGTRTLERLIQQYGSKHIKAVAIDGPLPLSISALNDANILEPLDEIIRICAESGLCSADNQPMPVGQARSGFIDSITELAANPRYTKSGVKIEASDVFQFLLSQMSQGNLDYVVPMTIALSQKRLDDALGLFDFDLIKVLVPNPMGLYYSAICSDESPNKPSIKGAGWPTPIKEAAAKSLNPLTSAICAALPTNTVEPFTDKGFVFNKPTIVTVGQLDPVTPSSNFSKIQARFQKAIKLEFTGLSHGLVESDLCVQTKIAEFLENPQIMPSTNCAP